MTKKPTKKIILSLWILLAPLIAELVFVALVRVVRFPYPFYVLTVLGQWLIAFVNLFESKSPK